MQEEIFCPFLPLIEYEDDDEVIEFIESLPHTLAPYIQPRAINSRIRSSKIIILNLNQSLHPSEFKESMLENDILYKKPS
ncbi:MAG: hypothetical protein ACW964_15290 [Candidatus Hodarchaeales archaeon]|jgi:acyl-CoA reductase-like NAD-dependent aldehyde dehydrogenase